MFARAIAWLLIVFIALSGGVLAFGGAELIRAGGSVYYLLAGLALLGVAGGLAARKSWAFRLYGVLLGATLVWALWESWLDGWALVPRLVAPAVLGAILLLPVLRRRAEGASSWWISAPVLAIFLTFGASASQSYDQGGRNLRAASPIAMADRLHGEWRNYGRTLSGDRFSPVRQIDTGNVGRLKLAWRYVSDVPFHGVHSFEVTPLAVGGRLYACLDRNVIVALDQDSGREVWRFDPQAKLDDVFAATCRGVAYHEAPQPLAQCTQRILFGVADNRMMAIDARTGRRCETFGTHGAVDLTEGLGTIPKGIAFPTSPPTIVRGVALISGWITDGDHVGEPSGGIRAYDAVTGELRWVWDTGRPNPQEPLKPGGTYTKGAPNAWGVFSGDDELGLAYVPTGNSTPDYFGAHRSAGAEKFSTSVVALDVATGKPRWSSQLIHHDLWDYDVGAQPVLADVPIGDIRVPALIASTKTGQFFIFDRRNGRPLYPVTEKPVPQGAAPGDWTAPTQPYSAFPDVAGGRLSESLMWGATPFDQLWCRVKFRQARYEGDFTPAGLRAAIHFPGSAGGVNWGSITVDAARGLLVSDSLYMPDIVQIHRREDAEHVRREQPKAIFFPMKGTPYVATRDFFRNPIGVPCLKPPYGRVSVFDLNAGKLVWSKALGTASRAGPFGLESRLPFTMGAPLFGGALTTAGGVIFIGASQDRMFRAIDIGNGRELWSASLPGIGAASPMTFVSKRSGRQYVVIASGNHSELGGPETPNTIMAYALPEASPRPESRRR
jgi:membrane-bound PQQ-dependent dehydrogenase (glucose/quinate/shikimate family)